MPPKESQTPTFTNDLVDTKPEGPQRHRKWYNKRKHHSRGIHIDASDHIDVSLTRNQREEAPNVPGSAVPFAQGSSLTDARAVTTDSHSYFRNSKANKSDNRPQNGTVMLQRASFRQSHRPKCHEQAATLPLCVQMDSLNSLPLRARELAQQLIDNTCECLSCIEVIKIDDAIWSCSCCFNMFHLRCIQRWAREGARGSSQKGARRSFCCPQCRAEHTSSVQRYHCFCGKVVDPPYDPLLLPHSCGDSCGRGRPHGCPHPCALRCHPGPCAACTAVVGPVPCPCGATAHTYPCGRPDPSPSCGRPCGRALRCGAHRCERDCHPGDCGDCPRPTTARCPCGRAAGRGPCGAPASPCGAPCGKPLPCGRHHCERDCHPGDCPPCEGDPSAVRTCPCGANPLQRVRQSCLDPIPSCGGLCRKTLACSRHSCSRECHTGPCPPCVARLEASCRCRQVRKLVDCAEADNFQCTRVCGTRLSCGRHYCNVICCQHRNQTNVSQHECRLVCGRKLKCGHVCCEPCHRGACPSCIHFTTEPLYCRCGQTMLMPPQPCDAKPPDCPHLCEVRPACGHPPAPHRCHFGDCPVCTYLVSKTCVGGHTEVMHTPCWKPYVTCPQKCRKVQPSCGHICSRACHSGPCVDAQHPCTHPCEAVHSDCGHACGRPCHVGSACPPCQHLMTRTCECGRISRTTPCVQLRARMACHRQQHPDKPFEIPCNKDCLREARLTILAALGGVATHTSSPSHESASLRSRGGDHHPLIPFFYSIDLWEYISVKGVAVVEQVEKQLENFLAGSKPLASLPPARAEKRGLVHSIAVYYKIEVESVDDGTQRSCLLRRKPSSHMPPMLLSEAVKSPELYDPRLFFSAVVQPPRMESAPPTSPSSKGLWEPNEPESGKEGESLLRRMAIKGSTKGKSLLPQLGIYVFGEAVNERSLAQLLSPELVGSFVFGCLEECDDRNKALLVFTSASKQQEGYKKLRQKAAPFQFWIPIE